LERRLWLEQSARQPFDKESDRTWWAGFSREERHDEQMILEDEEIIEAGETSSAGSGARRREAQTARTRPTMVSRRRFAHGPS
jgi:hypothetical protein